MRRFATFASDSVDPQLVGGSRGLGRLDAVAGCGRELNLPVRFDVDRVRHYIDQEANQNEATRIKRPISTRPTRALIIANSLYNKLSPPDSFSGACAVCYW